MKKNIFIDILNYLVFCFLIEREQNTHNTSANELTIDYIFLFVDTEIFPFTNNTVYIDIRKMTATRVIQILYVDM